MLLSLSKNGIQLTGLGHYLPEQCVSNQELIQIGNLPVDDNWIQKRIGVQQRYFAQAEQSTSDLALKAALQAMQAAQASPDEIDLILLSTISPDHPSPATACAIQAALGIKGCPAFDITAACSGFIYGLDIASRYVLTGARKVLLISAEIRSRFVDLTDPSMAPIFGDAAAAVILEPGPVGQGLLAVDAMADGSGYYSVYLPAGGARRPASHETVDAGEHFLKMPSGEKVFFEVVEGMSQQAQRFLADLNLTVSDIDFVIPHQANLMILKEVARRLELPFEKMLINLPQVGNTSSASIPLAWSQLREDIPTGSKVLLMAAGAGHTAGMALVKT